MDIYAGINDDKQSPAGDEAAFDVELDIQGDPGSGFRTKNDPRPEHQWHRDDITQRKGAIGVKCNMTDIIHGKLSDASDDEYITLIVLLFRFDVRNNSRRIARADITVNFSGKDEEDPYSRPEIYDISFNDVFSLVKKSQSESITQGISGTASVTAAQVAELSGSLKWEKTTSREIDSYTTVIGNTYRRGFEFGGDNQVNWILKENEEFQSGIPVAFRAGILLKRGDEMPFKCDVKIDLKADIRSRLESFFGSSKPKDDSVLFNPKVKVSARKLGAVDPQQLDTNNLGKFDLESVSDITFLRVYDGAVKAKK
ncbi:hypothetical protein FHL15_008859 [Xylaria flabelliformis]|uniref:Uncharacterized protein n=1 Tax=Xylaria flabelliformis TaxID=2512241 RepID=A0A553HQT7_9PEZI|nr:hypothetical protein FHL15_008859 [Xylaria flabelliformis]